MKTIFRGVVCKSCHSAVERTLKPFFFHWQCTNPACHNHANPENRNDNDLPAWLLEPEEHGFMFWVWDDGRVVHYQAN
jgi:hypothetical protein